MKEANMLMGKRGEICLLITHRSLGKHCLLGKLYVLEVKLIVAFFLI